MHIYFRTDGNDIIASGHIMRCLSIADACKEAGHEVTFMTADDCCSDLIAQRGYNNIVLHGKWNDLEHESEEMVTLIHTHDIQVLIIDSYYVTEQYLNILSKETKTVYIDDLNAFHYPVDTLIHYSICADKFMYPTQYPDTKLLLGCRYAPLRMQFRNIEQKIIRVQIKNILITTGGTDAQNIAGELLNRMLVDTDFEHVSIHVVTGTFCSHQDALRALEKQSKNIFIESNVTNMAALMIESDVAISAGGSTLYELSACGVPTVTYSVADNQLDNVNGFAERDLIKYAGDVRNGTETCVDHIVKAVKYYMHHPEKRTEVSRNLQQLVDGMGSEKIAAHVLEMDGD